LYEEYANNKGILKPLLALQVNKIKKEEIEMYKNSDACIAVTAKEVDFVKKYNNNSYEVPNGIEIADFKFNTPVRRENINLLFVGNFTYFPNVSAIENFYKDIFKKLNQNIKLT